MHIDHAALAPLYALVGTLMTVLFADLVLPVALLRRAYTLLVLSISGIATAAVLAITVTGNEHRATFCVHGETLPSDLQVGRACSFVTNHQVVLMITLLCVLALIVLAYSFRYMPALGTINPKRIAAIPANSGHSISANRFSTPPNNSLTFAGEYCFLLLCSLLGALVLTGARDLLTLIVALETLTLPLYALVSMGRGGRSAEGAMTFFVISVLSTSVTLLGTALIYATTGAVHLSWITAVVSNEQIQSRPLIGVAAVLLLGGLLFKVAVVPFHAWVPATYDGAPLPVTAWLATVSKVGGWIAMLLIVTTLYPYRTLLTSIITVLAVVTMTLGNVIALRQHRLMRLLAWSSVAQLGYVIAPLGVANSAPALALSASAIYLVLYVFVVLGVFGALATISPLNGGDLAGLAGLAKRQPVVAVLLTLGFLGLAGLPPGFAGMWAKIALVRGVLSGEANWAPWVLAAAIGINVVIGLAVYLRVVRTFFQADTSGDVVGIGQAASNKVALAAAVVVAVMTMAIGIYPQPVMGSVDEFICGLFFFCH